MPKNAKYPAFLLALAVFSLAFCLRHKTPPAKADLVLSNGNVVTLSAELPRAQAIAISGNRIIGVGDAKEVKPYIGEKTKVIDLAQRLVIPGLIDAHLHPFSAGRALTILDLKGLSKEEILERVARKVQELKKGEWLEAEGWDQGFWREKEFPT